MRGEKSLKASSAGHQGAVVTGRSKSFGHKAADQAAAITRVKISAFCLGGGHNTGHYGAVRALW